MALDKYGTGNDPYCYRDSEVLCNVLNIQNSAELEEAEQALTALAALQIELQPPPYNLDYFKAVHQHLFRDLYEWAGELRTIDITKGTTRFCSRDRISPEANKTFKVLKKDDYYIKHERKDLIADVAELYIELNMLHPFREGNGRAQRILFEHIIINCGFEFDLEGITKREWVDANIAGVSCNYTPMTELFTRCIGDKFIE